MSVPALQLDHLALEVFDVEATYRFYHDVLQLPLVNAMSGDDWDGRPWLMMIFRAADGRQLALCAFRGARRPADTGSAADLPHFAFSVQSRKELDEWKQRLEVHGVAYSEEHHGGAQRSIYFHDPNGIVLEVTAPSSSGAMVKGAAYEVIRRWVAAEES